VVVRTTVLTLKAILGPLVRHYAAISTRNLRLRAISCCELAIWRAILAE
jgi:hypothetical protein